MIDEFENCIIAKQDVELPQEWNNPGSPEQSKEDLHLLLGSSSNNNWHDSNSFSRNEEWTAVSSDLQQWRTKLVLSFTLNNTTANDLSRELKILN